MSRSEIENTPIEGLGAINVGTLPNVELLNIPHKRKGRIKHVFGTSGGRTIIVTLFTDRKIYGNLQANTYIDAGDEHTRIPGSTTALYAKARELMQQTADRRGEVLTYTFHTYSQSMIAWALEQGQELFDWQDIDEGEEFTLTSKISPKK